MFDSTYKQDTWKQRTHSSVITCCSGPFCETEECKSRGGQKQTTHDAKPSEKTACDLWEGSSVYMIVLHLSLINCCGNTAGLTQKRGEPKTDFQKRFTHPRLNETGQNELISRISIPNYESKLAPSTESWQWESQGFYRRLHVASYRKHSTALWCVYACVVCTTHEASSHRWRHWLWKLWLQRVVRMPLTDSSILSRHTVHFGSSVSSITGRLAPWGGGKEGESGKRER